MPLNPLLAAADRLAPTPATTSYFDDPEMQSVHARYANSHLGAEAADDLFKAASQVRGAQLDEQRAAEDLKRDSRLQTEWDRHEVEHADKMDYMTKRGQFYIDLSNMNPKAPDYQQTRAALAAQLPMDVQDEAAHSIMAAKDAEYRSLADVQERERFRQDAKNERDADYKQRAQTQAAEYLTPEEINKFGDDILGMVHEAGRRSTGLREQRYDETIGADKRAREQERQSKATQEQTKTAAEQTLADLDAFPTQEMQLKFVKTDQSTPDELKQLAEAKVYDADRLKSETASALKFKDSEDYMKRHPDPVLSKELKASLTADQQAQKVKELTEAIRTKRKLFWQYAHDQRTLQEKEPPPVKPPPTTAPQASSDPSTDLLERYKKARAKVLGEER